MSSYGCLQGTNQCICDPPLVLFPFPVVAKDLHGRHILINKFLNVYRDHEVTRKNWMAKKCDRVCSVHFVDVYYCNMETSIH